jgi:hypothetical protein
MSQADCSKPQLGHPPASDEAASDAATLVSRFGRDGVEWLDRFLADYVFVGEPLDGVLQKARQLADLPPRMDGGAFDD